MIQEDLYIDKYEQYEALYDPEWVDDTAWPKPAANRKAKKDQGQIIAELTDDTGDVDLGFRTTYRPSRYESGWLLSSLYSFYNEGLIVDVLAQVKGGKEASVYLCEPHPNTGLGLLAAKVYRPRMFRNLRNDAMYRQGREILLAGGGPAGRDEGYIRRAIRSKTAFGQQAAHTSWLMYEFTAMERLYEAGGAVPRPIAPSSNAILMEYVRRRAPGCPDAEHHPPGRGRSGAAVPGGAAQRRPDVAARPGARRPVGLQYPLLAGGDHAHRLSPGGESAQQPPARMILKRDIQRTCEYFSQQGVDCNPGCILGRFWRSYVEQPHPEDVAADQSRLELALAEHFGH